MEGKKPIANTVRVCVPKIEPNDVLVNKTISTLNDNQVVSDSVTDLKVCLPKIPNRIVHSESTKRCFTVPKGRDLKVIIPKKDIGKHCTIFENVEPSQSIETATDLRVINPSKIHQTDSLDGKKSNLKSQIPEIDLSVKVWNLNCSYCSKKCFTEGELNLHEKCHIENKKLICPICSKGFARKSYLTEHMYIHDGQQPHECIYCQKTFSLRCNLIRHLRIHTGEKPFQCKICMQSFALKKNMIEHERIHTGERPFDCQKCDLKFSRRSSLIRHWNTRHTTLKQYACHECCKAFPNKSYLAKHVSIHLHKDKKAKRVRRTKAEIEKDRLNKLVSDSFITDIPDNVSDDLLKQSKAYSNTNCLPINIENIKIEESEEVCTPCVVRMPEFVNPYLQFIKEGQGEDISEDVLLERDNEDCPSKSEARKELYVDLPILSHISDSYKS